jgi:dienelactone hydrolase
MTFMTHHTKRPVAVAVVALLMIGRGLSQDNTAAPVQAGECQRFGVQNNLPVFYEKQAGRLVFPFSWAEWGKRNGNDFDRWRKESRERVRLRFLAAPPPVPFEPQIIGSRKRKGYTSHKIAFNLTGDSRVLAYLLVPEGVGPHPGVLLLHDHGAEFRIGKEKYVEPWDVAPEKSALAREWVDKVYGGRFLGDELAARGYVCLCYDALNWSDRGGAGYDGQQALASNLQHLGMSLAGLIAHEDLRGAQFLASRQEVDPRRIAAIGHSMGAFRTWQVAAMSDHIAAGVSVCWIATVKGLMVPGNNQTKGASAFTMTHPGLFNDLDYPDLASLACPKPMLFLAGQQDTLFPVASVREAFAKMQHVWDSQGAGDKLVTKIWPVPHLFNAAMQEESFTWLDQQLKSRNQVPAQKRPYRED